MRKIISLVALVLAAYVLPQTVGQQWIGGHEFGVSLGTGYVLDSSSQFQDEYAFNVQAGVSYFFTRNIGVEVWVPFYTEGVAVQEVQAGVLFRFPLAKEKAFWKGVAPYVGIGGVYNWDEKTVRTFSPYTVTSTTEPPPCCGGEATTSTETYYAPSSKEVGAEWAYIAKLGTELRVTPSLGVFVEGQYRNDSFDDFGEGQVSLVGGIKVVF